MKHLILSALLLAAAGAWSADEPAGEDSATQESQDAAETALKHLSEARRAFDDAIRQVESIEFRQVFDNGAMLGVVIRDDEAGVRVVGVTPDSGAEVAGILADDVITAIDGKALGDKARPARALRRAMDDVEPGDTVRIVLARGGEEREFEVEAMRRPHAAGPFHWRGGDTDFSMFPEAGKHVRVFRDRAMAAAHGKGGLQLVDIGEDLGKYFGVDAGVLVLNVPPGSALKPGDILRRIDDADIGNANEAYRLLAELEAAGEATVRRENRSRTVGVEPLEGLFKRAYRIMLDRSDDDETAQEEEVEIEVEVE